MGTDHASLRTLECGGGTWMWQGEYVTTKMALELLLDPLQTEVENQAGSGRGCVALGWVLRGQRGKDYKP